MLNKNVENVLNKQISLEAYSSQFYLAMASWAEKEGLRGVANFLYQHVNEERVHMIKLYHYINDRGGHSITSEVKAPENNFKSIKDVFEQIYKHELFISTTINDLLKLCIEEGDFTTQSFLQWYVTEQVEEESLFSELLQRINLLGSEPYSLYLFDKDIEQIKQNRTAAV